MKRIHPCDTIDEYVDDRGIDEYENSDEEELDGGLLTEWEADQSLESVLAAVQQLDKLTFIPAYLPRAGKLNNSESQDTQSSEGWQSLLEADYIFWLMLLAIAVIMYIYKANSSKAGRH